MTSISGQTTFPSKLMAAALGLSLLLGRAEEVPQASNFRFLSCFDGQNPVIYPGQMTVRMNFNGKLLVRCQCRQLLSHTCCMAQCAQQMTQCATANAFLMCNTSLPKCNLQLHM